MSTAVELQSVVLDEQGRPVISGTRFKVLVLIQDHLYWGLTPEQMVRQHEGLTLAHAYAALAFYYEHRDEVDVELDEWKQEYERLLEANKNSPLRQRLRAQGLIP
jgi:uncharacterized protein (DUF433 family)